MWEEQKKMLFFACSFFSFFRKVFVVIKKIHKFAIGKPVLLNQACLTLMELTLKSIVTRLLAKVSKRRLSSLLSVNSNFANLKPYTEVMQRERLRRVYYILSLVMCILIHYLCLDYDNTWRGLAALLILVWGQCEGLSSGIGAKVEFPTSFLFPKFMLIHKRADS